MVVQTASAPCVGAGYVRGMLADTLRSHNQTTIQMINKEQREIANMVAERIMCTQKEVLTSDEAARYLGVSKSCLYKWTMTRTIPHYKSPTGKMCFFNRREIEEWMQQVRVKTDDELEQQAQAMARKGGRS